MAIPIITAPTDAATRLAGPLVPLDLGGGGLSAAETCELLEAFGEGSRDPGLGLAAVAHAVLATVPMRAFGTPDQRRHYLPRMASGEWTGAVSLLQTQGASLAPTVNAQRAEKNWILDGTVDLVAGAPAAHHFLVIAADPDGERTAFLVDRDTPGLQVEPTGSGAMPSCLWGRLTVDSCRLGDDAVLGTPRAAAREVEPLLAALDWVFTCAPWIGVMRALLGDAVADARDRHRFGRPLAHSQSVRLDLADMAVQCELAAGMLHRAAAEFDVGTRSGARPSYEHAATTRLFTAAAVRSVTAAAAHLHSADGLAERAHRDAAFFAATGGGGEVLRAVVAASVLELG
ncbi:acyl-CoA dehydrogenase family protein [Glycomyces sp. YM15]|uniref:acyl-CoA dehydrogenase family protein n=1 Tax=Glycomyces sp. YM15 TaxID=2800446 RepID=UPI001966C66F|nr:acyl-CoA dehydrogenase family protein [Glycomyces sp. YM15]